MRRLRFEAVCRELSVKALLEAILDEKLPKLAEQTRRSRQKL
jgi:hypothetical protein